MWVSLWPAFFHLSLRLFVCQTSPVSLQDFALFIWVLCAALNLSRVLFTSWYDVSHAMRFRVWGRNSIKSHSLTLLDINLCNKPGLNTFSSPPRQVYLFIVTVYVYLGGGTKAIICRTTWTNSKWRPVTWSVMVFWFQAWSKHTFVEPKMERKYATEYSTAEKWASES